MKKVMLLGMCLIGGLYAQDDLSAKLDAFNKEKMTIQVNVMSLLSQDKVDEAEGVLLPFKGVQDKTYLSLQSKVEKAQGHLRLVKYTVPSFCQSKVESMLKAPKSAEFDSMFNSPKYTYDSHSFFLQSSVHSQNSFGAMIKTNFVCEGKLKANSDPAKETSWDIVVEFLK